MFGSAFSPQHEGVTGVAPTTTPTATQPANTQVHRLRIRCPEVPFVFERPNQSTATTADKTSGNPPSASTNSPSASTNPPSASTNPPSTTTNSPSATPNLLSATTNPSSATPNLPSTTGDTSITIITTTSRALLSLCPKLEELELTLNGYCSDSCKSNSNRSSSISGHNEPGNNAQLQQEQSSCGTQQVQNQHPQLLIPPSPLPALLSTTDPIRDLNSDTIPSTVRRLTVRPATSADVLTAAAESVASAVAASSDRSSRCHSSSSKSSTSKRNNDDNDTIVVDRFLMGRSAIDEATFHYMHDIHGDEASFFRDERSKKQRGPPPTTLPSFPPRGHLDSLCLSHCHQLDSLALLPSLPPTFLSPQENAEPMRLYFSAECYVAHRRVRRWRNFMREANRCKITRTVVATQQKPQGEQAPAVATYDYTEAKLLAAFDEASSTLMPPSSSSSSAPPPLSLPLTIRHLTIDSVTINKPCKDVLKHESSADDSPLSFLWWYQKTHTDHTLDSTTNSRVVPNNRGTPDDYFTLVMLPEIIKSQRESFAAVPREYSRQQTQPTTTTTEIIRRCHLRSLTIANLLLHRNGTRAVVAALCRNYNYTTTHHSSSSNAEEPNLFHDEYYDDDDWPATNDDDNAFNERMKNGVPVPDLQVLNLNGNEINAEGMDALCFGLLLIPIKREVDDNASTEVAGTGTAARSSSESGGGAVLLVSRGADEGGEVEEEEEGELLNRVPRQANAVPTTNRGSYRRGCPNLQRLDVSFNPLCSYGARVLAKALRGEEDDDGGGVNVYGREREQLGQQQQPQQQQVLPPTLSRGGCPKLRSLNVASCGLSEAVPFSPGEAGPQRLSAALAVGACPRLEFLSVAHNRGYDTPEDYRGERVDGIEMLARALGGGDVGLLEGLTSNFPPHNRGRGRGHHQQQQRQRPQRRPCRLPMLRVLDLSATNPTDRAFEALVAALVPPLGNVSERVAARRDWTPPCPHLEILNLRQNDLRTPVRGNILKKLLGAEFVPWCNERFNHQSSSHIRTKSLSPTTVLLSYSRVNPISVWIEAEVAAASLPLDASTAHPPLSPTPVPALFTPGNSLTLSCCGLTSQFVKQLADVMRGVITTGSSSSNSSVGGDADDRDHNSNSRSRNNDGQGRGRGGRRGGRGNGRRGRGGTAESEPAALQPHGSGNLVRNVNAKPYCRYRLRCLDLSSNPQIRDDDIVALAEALTESGPFMVLTTLNLSEVDLRERGAVALAGVISGTSSTVTSTTTAPPTPTTTTDRLNIPLPTEMTMTTNQETGDITVTRTSRAMTTRTVRRPPAFPALRSLDLSSNEWVGQTGLTALARSLVSEIKEGEGGKLDPPPPPQPLAAAEHMQPQPQQKQSEQENGNDSHILTRTSSCPLLEALNMSSMSWDLTTIQELCAVLSSDTISRRSTSSSDAPSPSSSCFPNLQLLTLRGSHLNDSEASEIASSLLSHRVPVELTAPDVTAPVCPRLISVDLSENDISRQGARALVEAVVAAEEAGREHTMKELRRQGKDLRPVVLGGQGRGEGQATTASLNTTTALGDEWPTTAPLIAITPSPLQRLNLTNCPINFKHQQELARTHTSVRAGYSYDDEYIVDPKGDDRQRRLQERQLRNRRQRGGDLWNFLFF